MSVELAECVMVLRDEVLDLAEVGDRDPPGAEVFDAVVRGIAAHGETFPGLDLTLHDAIARRLAWGDRDETVLADADAVCRRLIRASQRSFRDPAEEVLVVEVATEVACAAARIITMAAVGRAGRERGAHLRDEMSQRRLHDALARQKDEISRLEASASDSSDW